MPAGDGGQAVVLASQRLHATAGADAIARGPHVPIEMISARSAERAAGYGRLRRASAAAGAGRHACMHARLAMGRAGGWPASYCPCAVCRHHREISVCVHDMNMRRYAAQCT